MSNQIRSRYDIIINGGGIVGFTLLNLILKSPHLSRFKVLLLEQGSKPSSFRQPPRYLDKLSSDSEWGQTEAEKYNEKKFANRVSSITLASKSILGKLGVWDRVQEHSKAIKNIEVWNYDYAHRIKFNQVPSNRHVDGETMFSVVENNRLSLALLDNIYSDSRANDAILWERNLDGLRKSTEQGYVDIDVKTRHSEVDELYNGILVLGCDGFKSKVRDLARFKYNEINLGKTAIVGTVKLDRIAEENQGDNDIAHQRFSALKDTVAALLPLDSMHSSFVISAPDEYAKYLMDCDDESFIIEFNQLLSGSEQPTNILLQSLHEVANQTCTNLSNFLNTRLNASNFSTSFDECPRLLSVIENSRANFPLVFGTTTPKMVSTLPGNQHCQIALLGDSSHRVHPLAGQGLNLGIQDAAELVKQLEALAKCGEKVFDPADLSMLHKALKRYECRRQTYIAPMSAGILSMQSLFKLMPSSFVSSVDRCELIKKTAVSFANGC